MKILLASDIHERHGQSLPSLDKDCDVIILAGDIGCPYKIKEKIKDSRVPVIYIAGNHEYYGNDFDKVNSDVFNNTNGCYNNYTVVINGVNIHVCTLWTDLHGYKYVNTYNNLLNDSRMIKDWDGVRAQVEFKRSFNWLNSVIQEGDIVVTHHSPSFMGMHPKWASSQCNMCFHSDLDDFIIDKKPSLWLHGHIHEPVDYKIGSTRIVANPHGYPSERADFYSKYDYMEIIT